MIRCLVLLALCSLSVMGQTATLGLADGFLAFNTSTFSVQLVKDSQTLYSLKPGNGSGTFDFIPADKMTQRQFNGNVHLGDISYRVRPVGSTGWVSGDTFSARHTVRPLPASGDTLAAADLSPTLPANAPLNITRRWVTENGTLTLFFDVTNTQSSTIEIGALGAPLEFNNVRHTGYLNLWTVSNRCCRSSQTEVPQKLTSCAVCSIPILDRMPDTCKSYLC